MICEWPDTKLCAFGIPHYPLATVTIRVFKGPGAAREEKSLHRLTVEYPMTSIQRFAQITQHSTRKPPAYLGKPLTWHVPYLATRPSRQRYARPSPKASSKPQRQVSATRFACERQD